MFAQLDEVANSLGALGGEEESPERKEALRKARAKQREQIRALKQRQERRQRA